jgi:hypothetical protein
MPPPMPQYNNPGMYAMPNNAPHMMYPPMPGYAAQFRPPQQIAYPSYPMPLGQGVKAYPIPQVSNKAQPTQNYYRPYAPPNVEHNPFSNFIPPDVQRQESMEEVKYEQIANKPRAVRVRTSSNWNMSRPTTPFEIRESLSTEERYHLVPSKSKTSLDFQPYSHQEYINLKAKDQHMKLPNSLGHSVNDTWRQEVKLR